MSRSAMSVGVFAMVLVGMFLAGPVSTAVADHESEGVVVSVDDAAGSFVLKAGDANVTVKVNDTTAYSVGGEKADKAAVLVAGAKVKVTQADGLASKVDRTKE